MATRRRSGGGDLWEKSRAGPAVNRRAVNRRAMVEVIREPWLMAVVAAVVAAVAVAERARGQWRSHGFRYTHWRDSNGFVLSPTSMTILVMIYLLIIVYVRCSPERDDRR